ncbi:MAG: AAA family ATPase [Candidatus Micrarchaeales archaeon]|nr:AAA family ATPase [Candidatus Micrarchaeales archaeon]
MKVLIIGIPGTGKSHLAEKMRRKNITAVDADLFSGIVKLVDKYGRPLGYNSKDKAIRAEGDGIDVFNLRTLASLLKENDPLYVFTFTVEGQKGRKNGVLDIMKLFDKVYYLKASASVIKHRLKTRSSNGYGKKPSEVKQVMWSKREWDAKAEKLGLKAVSATLPAEEIIKIITS